MRYVTWYWKKRRPRYPSLEVGDVVIVHDYLRYLVVQRTDRPVSYILATLNPRKPTRHYELIPYRGLRRVY